MKVNFSFTQAFVSAYPEITISITFLGVAYVNHDRVTIISVSEKGLERYALTIPKEHAAQNLATGQMGIFLGMCREAARAAAYKVEKQKQRDAELVAEMAEDSKSQHNNGFWPRASNTKYMNSDHE